MILLLLLPFGILWVLIRLLPPWQEEESEGETESQLAPKPEAQVMA